MLHFLFSNETDVAVQKTVFAKILVEFGKTLKTNVKKVLNGRDGEISLTLVDDKKIKELNSKYRKIAKPTDVLSFAYTEGKKMTGSSGPAVQIGDIFISVDTAKRQAKEREHSLKRELCVLFTHGLLHLFGFDHKNDREEAEMEKFAKKILKHGF
ncbi:MAG: rRNA maturation RNase YbeY [Candidatus Gracilibacteria bacterium]|jgi:probable rRNA maturation factor